MTLELHDELKTQLRLTRDEVDEMLYGEAEYCPICDGQGHGFPGGDPCPLS